MTASSLFIVILASSMLLILASMAFAFGISAGAMGMGFWQFMVLVAGHLSRLFHEDGDEEEEQNH